MPYFSNRWGLPSCLEEANIRSAPKQRCDNAAPCRARLEGWIKNVAARSPIWGDIDLAAFCRRTGFSREHATRELSKIRRDHPTLAFETKQRRKNGKSRKRWGVMVAERRKLRFDERSLFYDARGNRLHNHTTLGDGGRKIPPTAPEFGNARRPRGKPRRMPGNAKAVLDSWRDKATPQDASTVNSQTDKPGVSVSDKPSVAVSDAASDENPRVCDGAYMREDSFGIQQTDLYGARRDVAQWRGSGKSGCATHPAPRLRRKAFAMLKPLADSHWDNCKVLFARPTAYCYALRALVDGHDERRIVSRYSDALFVCHGFAVDQAASTGKITFFNPSSTVGKARELLAKDGLTRDERVANWYRKRAEAELVPPIPPEQLVGMRAQIAASLAEASHRAYPATEHHGAASAVASVTSTD